MATLVYVNRLNGAQLGGDLLDAIDKIRDGLMALHNLDGRRAQTIAVSPAAFGAAFGISDPSQAQAMSDRLAAIEGGNYAGLPDLLDATLRQVT